MNPAEATRATALRLAEASGQQRWLRGLLGVGVLGFLALVPVAGGDSHAVFSAVLALAALLAVLAPDSAAALMLVLGLGGLWAISVPDLLTAWSLAAAALLFAIHLLAALASYGPPELVLPRSLLALWGRRCLVALSAGVLVWMAARILDPLDLPGSGLALAVALGVLLVWVGFLSRRLLGRDAT